MIQTMYQSNLEWQQNNNYIQKVQLSTQLLTNFKQYNHIIVTITQVMWSTGQPALQQYNWCKVM